MVTQLQWTWLCHNNICKRFAASNYRELQTLATCNMLCETGHLWPQPTGQVSLGSAALPVKAEDFSLRILATPSTEVSQYITEAFQLMKQEMLHRLYNNKTTELRNSQPRLSVVVKIKVTGNKDARLRLNTDESYKLTLRLSNNNTLISRIKAQSFCGARHGLETLSQLVWLDTYVGSLLILDYATIKDAPKFGYRGLLLDTSRNYFPVADILRTIDAMGANKLNTFHWHATDSQSFPLQLKSVPQLAASGAYGPGAVYTSQDVQAVVHRARLRGVRVILEVDTPAHVGEAWNFGPDAGLGNLVMCDEPYLWPAYCGTPPCGQLNPRNPNVFILLENIYREIIQLTGVDDVFHLGGDEVSENCWRTHFNDTEPMDLWLEYTHNALQALIKANGGKAPELTLLWSSELTRSDQRYINNLDPNMIGIQIWENSDADDTRQILDTGFRVVISHIDKWYLDCGFGSWRESSNGHCGPYRSWQQIYGHRPWAEAGAGWQVAGGAACQWSEQLGAGGLDARLWPRAAALAERLWADRAQAATPDVYLRLDTQSARLLARGLAPAPLWPRWCTHNPHACL